MKTKIVVVAALWLGIAFAAQQTAVAVHAQAADSNGASKPGSDRLFLDTYQKHWTIARGLAVAVAEAMPEESYGFKPVSAEMSFGEQMLHIAQSNYGYCAFIADAKSPYPEPAKDAKIEKTGAVKDLSGSFDYCSKVFGGLDESKLAQMHGSGKRNFSAMEVMLGVMTHMAHHRGQAEVYLRLKGIAPPEYKW